MRLKILPLILLALLATSPLLAGSSSLTYTAGQSTAIQSQLIPKYNADHCQKFGLGSGCISADLVSGGCQVTIVKTIVLDSCTIFTQDAAGEALFLKEAANQALIATYNRLIAIDVGSYQAAECSRFKALSQANQNTECTLRGLASGCAGPCP